MTGRWAHGLNWTPEHVALWLKGLDISVGSYSTIFLNAGVDGKQLLNLTCDDLFHIGVTKVGHQHLLISAIDQLIQLNYDLDHETLQRVILRCASSANTVLSAAKTVKKLGSIENKFYNEITYDQERARMTLLNSSLSLMQAIKHALFWLDRPPFDTLSETMILRPKLAKEALELNVKTQIYVSKDTGLDDLELMSDKLAILCDDFVKNCRDILIITPCTLDAVDIRKQDKKDLGFNIHSTYNNTHVIDSVVSLSAAELTGKVTEGDEVVQVNNQTVVGWRHQAVVDAMRTDRSEVHLVLRKRPAHPPDLASLLGGRRRQHQQSAAASSGVVGTFPKLPRRRRGVLPQHNQPQQERAEEDVFGGSEQVNTASNIPRVRLSTYGGDDLPRSRDNIIFSPMQNTDLLDLNAANMTAAESTPTIMVTASTESDSTLGVQGLQQQTSSSGGSLSETHSGSELSLVSGPGNSASGSTANVTAAGVKLRPTRAGGRNTRRVDRRISCRDLGQGDCQGWLFMKKSSSKLNVSKWVRRFAVLKHNSLYYYKDPDAERAEGLINIPSLSVEHVLEVKQKRYAFRVYNGYVTFTFACESESDRTKWMNKLLLSSIGFKWPDSETGSPDKKWKIAGFTSPYYTEPVPPTVPPHANTPRVSATSTKSENSEVAPDSEPLVYSESESEDGGSGGELVRKQQNTAADDFVQNQKRLTAVQLVNEPDLDEADRSVEPPIAGANLLDLEPVELERHQKLQNRQYELIKRQQTAYRDLREKEEALRVIDSFLKGGPVTSDRLDDFKLSYNHVAQLHSSGQHEQNNSDHSNV